MRSGRFGHTEVMAEGNVASGNAGAGHRYEEACSLA